MEEDDEINPFLGLGGAVDNGVCVSSTDAAASEDAVVLSSILADSGCVESSRRSKSHPKRKRQWGIPDFEQQCNGVCSFEITVNRKTVSLQLEHRKCSTGSDVWDAALVLVNALPHLQDFTNKTVVELGSGTGAVGLVCAMCLNAKSVILTDLTPNLELLDRNRMTNFGSNEVKVGILDLDWQDDHAVQRLLRTTDESVDVIVGSDLFLPFAKNLLRPLARTLRDLLCTNSSKGVAWICYEERFDPIDFFRCAADYGLVVSEICHSVQHPEYQDPQIHILRITL